MPHLYRDMSSVGYLKVDGGGEGEVVPHVMEVLLDPSNGLKRLVKAVSSLYFGGS